MTSIETTAPETGFWATLRDWFAAPQQAGAEVSVVAGWDGLPVQVVETAPRRLDG